MLIYSLSIYSWLISLLKELEKKLSEISFGQETLVAKKKTFIRVFILFSIFYFHQKKLCLQNFCLPYFFLWWFAAIFNPYHTNVLDFIRLINFRYPFNKKNRYHHFFIGSSPSILTWYIVWINKWIKYHT